MASAQERLRASRASLDAGFPSSAVSAAYYAMLYAARAALSEEERNAKTHRGVWSLFSEVFVASGRFERELFAAAQRAQDLREAADYEAGTVPPKQADKVLADANRFVSGVASMLPS
jgi:uncharacterized protein (UPF0332 family)